MKMWFWRAELCEAGKTRGSVDANGKVHGNRDNIDPTAGVESNWVTGDRVPSCRSKSARKEWSSHQCPAILSILLFAVSLSLAQNPSANSAPVLKLIEQGRTLLKNRNPQQARRVLEEAVTRDPKSADAWSLLADSYSQLGLDDEAIHSYQTILRLRPGSPSALYNLGVLYFKHKRFEEAVGCLQAFRQQQPQDQEALSLLAQCLLQLGRRQDAISLLERALHGQQKTEKGLYLILASAFADSSENDRAIEVLYQAGKLWPTDEEVRLAMTSALMTKQDPAGTLSALRARDNKKLLLEDLQLLAGCYAANGRLEDARRFAEQAVAEGGGESSLVTLANILQLEGQNLEAIELMEPRRGEFSSSARYLFTLGLSYYNTGNYSGARDLFTKAISLNPSLAQAYYLNGNALARLGSADQALVQYEKAVRLAPDKFLYQYQLGLVLSNLGQKDRGAKHLSRSVELNGSYAASRYELARIYFETSRDDQAREQLEEAIKADPGYLSSFYLLSQVYERLGRHEDARRALAQFLTMQRQQHEEEKTLLQASPPGGKP